MKRKIAFAILVIILSTEGGTLYAQDVCFTASEATRILVDLERCRAMGEELALQREASTELEKQVSILQAVVEAKEKQINSLDSAVKDYGKIVHDQQVMCEKMIEQAKPTFWQRFQERLTMIGTGILIGLGVGLLL